jgi:hypothetical protein
LDYKTSSYSEKEAAAPKIKRQMVSGTMSYILYNPETKKWALITDEQVDELSNMYHLKKYGVSIDDDLFTFKG